MNTRRNDELLRLGDIVFYKEARLIMEILQQLPTHRYVYNRYLTLLSEKPLPLPNKKTIVINELAEERSGIWIYMNIPPLTLKGLIYKLTKKFKEFDKHRKVSENKLVSKWDEEYAVLKSSIEHGYDIKATKKEVIDQCVLTYGVTPGSEEEEMYQDNCTPNLE